MGLGSCLSAFRLQWTAIASLKTKKNICSRIEVVVIITS